MCCIFHLHSYWILFKLQYTKWFYKLFDVICPAVDLTVAIFICRKCQNDETAYPAFGLENLMNLEDLTAHWTWPSLPKALTNIKVDLKGLKILTPNLQQQLQNLLYACDLNLTAHRIMVSVEFIYQHLHCRNFPLSLSLIFLYSTSKNYKIRNFTETLTI